MNTIAESRKASLINLTYIAVIVVAFFLFMKYAFWLFAPFIFALAVAVILQKPINKISQKTKFPKGFVAGVTLILFIIILLGLFALAGFKVYKEIIDFKNFIIAKFNDLPNLIRSIEKLCLGVVDILPASISAAASASVKNFASVMIEHAENGDELSELLKLSGLSFSNISDKLSDTSINISGIASPVISTAMALPSKIVSALIFFIASFFLTCDYDNIVGTAKRSMKKSTAMKLSTVKRITLSSLGKMAKSYAIIIFITFCEISIGLYILKLCHVYEGAHLIIISLCTALLDILPIFGTGTVIIPWAIYNLLIAGNIGFGIGLVVIYCLITVIRQIVEPKLVGANLGIPPILTLMGMYIGLETIGVIGMFVLPITIVVVKMLNEDGVIHLWGEKRELVTEKTLPEQEPIIKPVVQKISHAVKKTGSSSVQKKGKK